MKGVFHVEQRTSAAGETLPESVLQFEALLIAENAKQNLFSRSLTPALVRERLLLPCWRFATMPVVEAARQVLDIGSGGGLPGLLVALRKPERRVQLVESQQKKCRFLERAAEQLALPAVQVLRERVESLRLAEPPDMLCARFVADLATLERWTRHLRRPGSRLLVFKGMEEEAPERLRDLRLESSHAVDTDKRVLAYVSDPL